MIYLGDYPTGQTVYVPFHTFSSDDPSASMTITGLAVTDIEIYKNGGTTQRASDSGYALLDTDGIDFDGITGLHGISIDTSDNSDAGFYAAGNDYWVAISSITLDGATINFWAAIFSIDNRGLLRPTTAQRTLDVSATGEAGLDFDNINDATGAHTLTNITIPTCTTNTDMRGTDNAALASVVGALADAAAAGEVTEADTLMQYIKQLINILIGTPGIGTFPAEAAPGDGVSLAEVIRAIHADVTGLNGDAMRGTDGANTTTPPTAAAIADQVWDEAKSGHVGAGSFGEEVQAHSLSSEIAALNDLSAADVNAEVDTALSDYDPPTKTEMDAAFTEIKGATWASGTDTLEHIRDKQTDIETDTQDLQTQIGTAGAGLTDLGGMSAGMKAEVNTEADTALTDYDPPTKAEMDTAHGLLATEAKQDIIDTNVDTLVARLTAARAGYLDELDVSTSAKMAWYVKKQQIALVNKKVFTEATGALEQFNDSDVSIGTIASAVTSDGTYTTQLKAVQ